MANIPICVLDIIDGYKNSREEIDYYADHHVLFNIFMTLKLLRFLRIKNVTDALVRLKNIMADIFYLHRYAFDNLLRWVLAAFKLFLSMHIFACIWHIIASKEGGVLDVSGVDDDATLDRYIQSWYFVTTTITSVGYGSEYFKGFQDTSGKWAWEMMFLVVLEFTGIVPFSSVTNEIFSYKHLRTLDEFS